MRKRYFFDPGRFFGVIAAFTGLLSAQAVSPGDIFGVQVRLSTPNFQLLVDLNGASTVTDFTDGLGVGPGIFNGLCGLAALTPAPPPSFATTDISVGTDGSVTIVWESQADAAYSIRSTASVTEPWVGVAQDIPGDGESTSTTLDPSGSTEGCYQGVRQ